MNHLKKNNNLIEFATILLPLYACSTPWPLGSEAAGMWAPQPGIELLPLRWKVRSYPLDCQEVPETCSYINTFWKGGREHPLSILKQASLLLAASRTLHRLWVLVRLPLLISGAEEWSWKDSESFGFTRGDGSSWLSAGWPSLLSSLPLLGLGLGLASHRCSKAF